MGQTKLIEAVAGGDLGAVERLLASGVDVNERGSEQAWPALNYAAGTGDVTMIRVLLDYGADVAHVGLDERTPYLIALAAGRVEAARLLRDVERQQGLVIEAHQRARPYCKGYYLKALRAYPDWTERPIGREGGQWSQAEDASTPRRLADDDVVFLHQDYWVTALMWHDEDVLFNDVTEAWTAFCRDELGFRVPDDFDLIVPDDAMERALATQPGTVQRGVS